MLNSIPNDDRRCLVPLTTPKFKGPSVSYVVSYKICSAPYMSVTFSIYS